MTFSRNCLALTLLCAWVLDFPVADAQLPTRNSIAVAETGTRQSNVVDFHAYLASRGLGTALRSVGTDKTSTLSSTVDSMRRRGVLEAWKQERDLVMRTGQGTYPWTAAEKKELLATGKVKGYDGHHKNNLNSSGFLYTRFLPTFDLPL